MAKRNYGFNIDRVSFQLGMINCFAEMVACGVKRLALSPPLAPEDYRRIAAASDDIVSGFGIKSHLEKSLLVTDLQPEEFTRGKWSVLYFSDDSVLEEYLALKARKGELEARGEYDARARIELSRDFMRLLSYPDAVIDRKLSGGGQDSPFMLLD